MAKNTDLERYTDGELRDSYALLADQRQLNPHTATNGRLDVEYVKDMDEVALELQRRGVL